MDAVGKTYRATFQIIKQSFTTSTNGNVKEFGTISWMTSKSKIELLKKNKLPTLLICDSQAVKNTDTADIETKGFCRYKATNGIKRHLCVDVLGTPFFVVCTPANISDDDGFIQIVKENLDFFIELPEISDEYALTILLDSGYNKKNIENKLKILYPQILSKIKKFVESKMLNGHLLHIRVRSSVS